MELAQQLHRYIWFIADQSIRQGELLARILEISDGAFDGDVQALPIPSEFPPEVTRIQLKSADNKQALSVSLDRVVLEHSSDRQDSRKADLELAEKLFSGITKTTRGRIHRVAYNRDSRYDAGPDVAMRAVKYFCRPEMWQRDPQRGPLSRSETFEIHAHKSYMLGGVMINSWMRVKTNRLQGEEPLLNVQQDLNSMAGSTVNLEPADASGMVAAMSAEADAILELYFPQGRLP